MKTDPEAAAADIGKTLRSVAEFKRREKLQRQWLLVSSVAMAILLVVVVVDWFVAWQSGWGRWLGPLAVIAGCGFFLWRTIQTHLSKADRAGAARALDRASKETRDRWSTVGALLPGGAGATGSSAMASALITETAPMCRFIDPASVEPTPLPRRRIAVLITASLLLLGFLGVFLPQGSPRLLARFVLPWADLPLTRVDELQPPPNPTLRGDDVSITAKVSGKRTSAVTLEWADAQALPAAVAADPRQLTRQLPDDGKATVDFTVERLRQAMRYRLLAGDAVGEWREVGITERPKLSTLRVTLFDPNYSQRAPRIWQPAPESTSAVRGSSIEVVIEADRDLADAELEVFAGHGEAADNLQTLPLQKIADRRYRFDSELTTHFTFRPKVKSTEGYQNKALPWCQISVADDKAPTVELSSDTADEVISLRHDLPVSFEARDDLGVVSAELVLTVTDREGNQREITVPLDLGDQKGKSEVKVSTQAALADLGLAEDDQISYAVRVQDAFQQSSARNSKNQMANADGAGDGTSPPESGMTKRSLKIGEPGESSSSSKSQQLRIASQEMLNEIGPKEKKLLAIEVAFAQIKKLTISALENTRRAEVRDRKIGEKLDTRPLYAAVSAARKDIGTAERGVNIIAEQAPDTPYAFLAMQLQSFLNKYLQPADSKLNGSVHSRHVELPPREEHRRMAEGHLTQGLAALQKLEGAVAQVRSKVEAEFAMTELMKMYVGQIEDLPVLLGTSGDGTPYQRSAAEVSREQADAALKLLESKKELYKKTAELLRQHPELWQRYMDKSQKESKIYRDQLEALASRHARVRTLTEVIAHPADAPPLGQLEDNIGSLIAGHQSEIVQTLSRTLDKARTWMPQTRLETLGIAVQGNEPEWIEMLNDAMLQGLKNTSDTSLTSINDEALRMVREPLEKARAVLSNAVRNSSADRGFYAMRLAELEQAANRLRLSEELLAAATEKKWHHAALVEQADVARQTQQLAGKIEVESAGLSSLSDEVAGYGVTLMRIFQTVLMPPLASSVEHLKPTSPSPTDLAAATNAQEDAAIGYQRAVKALDDFVMAAIREKDKAPGRASASIAGLPSITARTLAELQEKLEQENQISESFGIPCCRPTNFQVMSDWEQFSQSSGSKPPSASGSTPASSSSESGPSSSQKQPPPSDPKAQAEANSSQQQNGKNGEPDGKGESPQTPKAGEKRSQMDVAAMNEGDGKGKAGENGKGQGKGSAEPGDSGGPKTAEAGKPGTGESPGQGAPGSSSSDNASAGGSPASAGSQDAAGNANSNAPPGQAAGPSLAELAREEIKRQSGKIAGRLSDGKPSGSGAAPGQGRSSASDLPGTSESDSSSKTASASTAAGAGEGKAGEGAGDSDKHSAVDDIVAAAGKYRLDDLPDGDRNWNRVGSQLQREFLQQRAETLPEQYREAIEEYFRELSKWKDQIGAAP